MRARSIPLRPKNRGAPMKQSGAGRAVGIRASMPPRWRSPQATTTAAKTLAKDVLKRLPNETHATIGRRRRAPRRCLFRATRRAEWRRLQLAAAADDATDSSKASTALQLSRLAPRLNSISDAVRKPLGVKTVALVTGHLFRGGEMDAEAQAKAAEVDPRPRRSKSSSSATSAISSVRSPAAPTSSWRRRRSKAAFRSMPSFRFRSRASPSFRSTSAIRRARRVVAAALRRGALECRLAHHRR